jgi:uncharacterized protein (TIGR04255 family)
MSEPTRFPNAPITEALLDIRVNLPGEVDLTQLATIQDLIKDQYPSRNERMFWQSNFQIAQRDLKISPPTGGPVGYAFTSRDGKQIVQVRKDGFSFSRLKPYEDWISLREEAKRLWQCYIQIASPTNITRLALRYINRIELPLPMRDFKDYILTVPEIAPNLPQGLADFFMQLIIPIPTMNAIAIVTETVDVPQNLSSVLPLIFDIDVFREAVFDLNSAEVWDTFEQLRELKNDIFFQSITERTKELFR